MLGPHDPSDRRRDLHVTVQGVASTAPNYETIASLGADAIGVMPKLKGGGTKKVMKTQLKTSGGEQTLVESDLALFLQLLSDAFNEALRVETKDAGSGLGTGGMATKILAARTASVSGIPCVLLNSSFPKRLLGLLDFAPPEAPDEAKLPEEATYFMAMDCTQTVHDTRRWIVSLPVAGELTLDDGAARALGAKKSLLPAGVRQVQGTFMRNEAVRLCHAGSEVARGIVNFSSDQLSRILGKSSHEFEDALGFSTCTEAIHRGNIILTTSVEALQAIEVVPRMRSSFSANQVTSLSRSDSMDSGMGP
ncbi:Glutamate 5-kinase [Symbiodinium microadriaticum]|uniref:Glutamate 5-kinase n=1 Tax=Symbiodinium microadriaticum TaxID=2951 RepID=A0A1Q9D5R3_SYMMI|nr:Glutamate 5-kinase [Symbiodinium microadriaticum]